MGTFSVSCRVSNVVDRSRAAELAAVLVDTGSEYTWAPKKVLEEIGISRKEGFAICHGQWTDNHTLRWFRDSAR